jgi:hypothetical protein
VSAGTPWAATAIALALLLTGCGSGVKTTIGKPQDITTALPGQTKQANPNLYPSIRTRFVLPHLDKNQERPVRAYVRWTVAYLQSLHSGKLDPDIKPLSSAKALKTVRNQTENAGQYGGLPWDTIVERVHAVTLGSAGAAITTCMVMKGANGGSTKQSLLTLVGRRDSGWYVVQAAPLPTKLPNC